MEPLSSHSDDDLIDNRNETSFFLNRHSEYDDSSYSFNSKKIPSFLLDKSDDGNEEVHLYSNQNKDSSKFNIIEKIGDNENLGEYIKIDEDCSPSLDKNKKNEKTKNISTKENSKENEEPKIEKVANNPNNENEIKITKIIKFKPEITRPSYWRLDYAKKHWKTKISQSLTNCINKKIKDSDLPEEYKVKIHKPNSDLFTANTNESDNYVFLSKDLRTIFIIGKDEDYDNQKNNDEHISNIYEYFEKIGYNNLSEKMLEIKNFFEMKYEDFIRMFYESEEFIIFKQNKNTKFYDEGTRRQEGFTISENYGLIKLLKRKKERDQISSASSLNC